MIRITSAQDGFRRCGIAHGKEPKEYQNDHFTVEQLAILRAEPMLAVTIIEDESKTTKAALKEAALKAEAEKKAQAEKEAAEKAASGKVPPIRLNAAKSIELVKTATTIEELDQFVIDQGEDRKSVLDAIEKRRDELAGEKS